MLHGLHDMVGGRLMESAFETLDFVREEIMMKMFTKPEQIGLGKVQKYIYIWDGGVWVQGAHACVILVLCECIWNVPAVSLVIPEFGNTGYCFEWSVSGVSTPVTASCLVAGNREAGLNLITFSSLLLFYVFLFFLFLLLRSNPNPSRHHSVRYVHIKQE